MSQPTAESLKALDARIAELSAQGKDVSALKQKREEDAAALKVKSSDDVGIIDPKNKDEAAAAKAGRDLANGKTDVLGSVGKAASDGASAVGDFFGNLFGGDDDDTPDANGKKSKFKWGNTIAGILGVIGAYLASSLFGGGILGTIMFALFAIPAFMMGRSQFGGSISGLIGEEPSKDAAVKASALNVSQAQSHTVGGVANANVPQVPQQPTPHQQLQAEVMEVAQKSQIARAAIIQQAQSGEINPRRANMMMQQVGRAEMAVQQMQGVDISRLNPDQLRAIGRQFDQTEGALDRAINTNPIIAAQIQQNIGPAPVAFAGATQNTIGANLTPEAQAQLQNVRQSTPQYQYQLAQQGAAVPQRFTGLPEQQPFMLPDAYIPR